MALSADRPAGGLASGTPPWVLPAQVAALVLVFLGERVVPSVAWLHWTLVVAGTAGTVALAGLRTTAARSTDGERRRIERALAALSWVLVAALAVYATTAEPYQSRLGLGRLATETRHKVEAIATVAWIAGVAVAIAPMILAELALWPMRRAATVEWRRARSAMAAAAALALAAAYGSLFVFVADEVDVKADYSYFKTSRPSEATRRLVQGVTEPIKVTAFFPHVNEAGAEVAAYLRDLGRGAPGLQVEVHDRLMAPKLAKEASIYQDGVLVIERGKQRETLTIGVEAQAARPKLKTLDQDFQKALYRVLKERRTALFTVGHGELNDAQPDRPADGRTARAVREVLEVQNYTVRDLGAATGLATDVPDDATIVFVLGPSHALAPEEVAALRRYADRGGKLFLALDPDAKVDNGPLAEIAGLAVGKDVLANDKVHLRRRFNDSDRVILATNRFSSHASVSTLSRVGSRPVFLLGATSLDKRDATDGAPKIDFAVRSLPDTFNDANGNFAYDAPAEKRQMWNLAAAVSRAVAGPPAAEGKKPAGPPEMRAFVVADADAVSDAALGNDGNLLLVADAVRWLAGEESYAGQLAPSAEDVRIEHTKQKDLAWFYGTIFAVPLAVLGGGLGYVRRVRRRPRAGAPAGRAS